jgi:hypothetical protein
MNPNRRSLLRAAGAFPLAKPIGLSAPFLITACSPGGDSLTAKSEVVLWNEVFVKAVRAGTLGPPMVARAMAIMNTAIFDAWAAFQFNVDVNYSPVTKVAFKPTVRDLDVAISFAAYRTIVDLYPSQKANFDAEMNARSLDPNDVSLTSATGVGVGNAAAAGVLGFRASDGSNQKADLSPVAYGDYTGYTPANTVAARNDPNRWQPLRFSTGAAPGFLAPHWGRVTPFSIASGDALRPIINLPRVGSPEMKQEADYVLDLTRNLTDEQKVIVEYWANGPRSETPPGHWNLITQWLSAEKGFSVGQDVRAFFAVSNAVMDAGIVCWDCKRAYDSPRPITVIRELYNGQDIVGFLGGSANQGLGPMPGASWHPYQMYSFPTPPFAEFTSGHSTFSSAAAEVLKQLTGSDAYGYEATITAGDPVAQFQANVPAQPVTLRWSTFTEAADQAGLSRLLGGIHFRSGNTYGKSSGRTVGNAVVNKMNQLLKGTQRIDERVLTP